ncbi:MAG: acyl carrier protein [Novosphingobium sp.]
MPNSIEKVQFVTQPVDSDSVLRSLLRDVLGLSADRTAKLSADSGLFGALPELDSMAVAGLLTELEDRFAIVIEDDEVDGDMLGTYGDLLAFVRGKRGEA